MNKTEMFHNLVNLAAVDGKFEEAEIRYLAEFAERWNIADDEFETAMAGLSVGEVQVQIPNDPQQRIMLLKEILRLMAVDGDLAPLEKQLCAQICSRMDLNEAEFDSILDSVISGESC